MKYEFQTIEPKWRKKWEDARIHHTVDAEDKPKDKLYYCLDMFPYPSGEGLHVGHWRGYVLSDVITRYNKLKKLYILHPMGWDAFGLPAENAAIKKGLPPRKNTDQNISVMRRQLKEIGAMYDWDKEIDTSSPEYYRWTQWFFLKFHQRGLAYRKATPVNWCPSCRTGLADEEVVDGKCERCSNIVTKKQLPQWFFKITDYADRLIEDLKDLDWPEKVKIMQENWVGKSRGAEVIFSIKNSSHKLPIFTTRPDTLFGATYMVLAPEHPLVEELTTPEKKAEVETYLAKVGKETEVERLSTEKEKTGVFIGAYTINPVNGKELPIFIADYVLMTYGTGAIMAVPAHDTRDFAFAQKYSLPIIPVIQSPEGEKELPYTQEGIMVNSADFNGLTSQDAWEKIVDQLESHGNAKRKINYRLRDWLISRQRYWGAPIPIIYCPKCGEVPVPEEQLPVLLPETESYHPTGTGESPLAAIPEFVNTKCPKCGENARRETDTISQWVCSSWYYLRYPSPHYQEGPFDPKLCKKWLPVSQYVGGVEHAVLHLLYSRFFTKVLFDMELVNFKEPFTRLFNQGMIYRMGTKMSKSKGNIVNPDELVRKYGTDALRAYELFIGPAEQDSEWDDRGIEGVFRWLKKVYSFFMEKDLGPEIEVEPELKKISHHYIKKLTDNIERFHLNTVVSGLMEFINALVQYEKNGGKIGRKTVETYLQVMAPVAPHLADELWEHLGYKESIFNYCWPQYDPETLNKGEFTLVVQINGKLKARLEFPHGSSKEEIEKAVLYNPKIAPSLEGKTLQRVIYVPERLLNLVIN